MANVIYRGQSYPISEGQDVLGVLLEHQAPISYICMAGACGTCKVKILSGAEHLAPPTRSEQMHCRNAADRRLACQAFALGTGDVVVEQ